jgi:peptidoglycan/xylan/chitin deacetylase (PgdA/CDA1 family)
MMAYLLAFLFSFFHIRYAIIPLTIFVIFCMIAPFLPGLGFFLPIVSRGKSGKKAVALTFDDGPDPCTTRALLGLLSTHGVKTTFFVIGEKAAAYPELIEEIIAQGHAIGNHSYHHDVWLMLRGYQRLEQEIRKTQTLLKNHGVIPLVFRPPVGITNPKLEKVLLESDMQVVNFSCRAMDLGNRRIKHLSEKILDHLRPDDIILLHDVMPKDDFLPNQWIDEVDMMISEIQKRGFDILPLEEIICQPVMTKLFV